MTDYVVGVDGCRDGWIELPSRDHWRSVGIESGAGADDMLDSVVAANTGYRVLLGKGERVPLLPESDPRGIQMEINF